ncbi:MAG: hypothetical protein N3D73_01025 [Candidatus Diapherotrites archaeon]|nr:hypothetical protein [Candidatus Diapherotrites archaeon]
MKLFYGIDINKKSLPKITESGGIAVLFSIWFLIILNNYLGFIKIDYSLLGWLLLISSFSIVGIIDDSKNKFLSKPIPWKTRAFFIALICLLFSWLFITKDLLLVILASLFIAAIASFHNTFAGLNGWEVGSSFIISIFTSILLVNTSYFYISLIISSSILALLIFNKYPARIFPGDSGTLLFGSSLGTLILLNQNLKILVIFVLFYIPHIIDFFFLKLLTNPKDVSQSKVKPYELKYNKLTIPKNSGYDFAKLIIKIFGPLEEWKIVLIIWIIVIINCSFWLLVIK